MYVIKFVWRLLFRENKNCLKKVFDLNWFVNVDLNFNRRFDNRTFIVLMRTNYIF